MKYKTASPMDLLKVILRANGGKKASAVRDINERWASAQPEEQRKIYRPQIDRALAGAGIGPTKSLYDALDAVAESYGYERFKRTRHQLNIECPSTEFKYRLKEMLEKEAESRGLTHKYQVLLALLGLDEDDVIGEGQ